MSNTLLLERVIEQATVLPQNEQLKLIEHLIHNMQQTQATPTIHKKWRDIRGMATYPLMGIDAQGWVSQNRSDSDNDGSREAQWVSSGNESSLQPKNT